MSTISVSGKEYEWTMDFIIEDEIRLYFARVSPVGDASTILKFNSVNHSWSTIRPPSNYYVERAIQYAVNKGWSTGEEMVLGVQNDVHYIALDELVEDLRKLGNQAQELVNKEFEKVNWQPEPGGLLNQGGLKDGFERISHYCDSKEPEQAFIHVLYMLFETDVEISDQLKQSLYSMAISVNWTEDRVRAYFE